MPVDLSTSSWQQLVDTPATSLLSILRDMLESHNPVCLLHPHGFYVTLLHRTEAEDWRFHFWPKGSRAVTGMPAFIHTHDRHVDSRILKGEIQNRTYKIEIVPNGGSPLYEVGYTGDRYQSKTTNSLLKTNYRARVDVQCSETLRAGDSYCVERHAYHEAVVPIDVATATLVRMHGRTPGRVMVVGLDGYPDAIAFTRSERRASEFVANLT